MQEKAKERRSSSLPTQKLNDGEDRWKAQEINNRLQDEDKKMMGLFPYFFKLVHIPFHQREHVWFLVCFTLLLETDVDRSLDFFLWDLYPLYKEKILKKVPTT
jgi:hypothetical protein